MEDDDEVQSQSSGGTGSPASPRSNGRITVSVSSAPPAQNNNSLTLALPIQHLPKTSGGSGREDCWSEDSTAVLIDAWGERYLELSRGNLKQQHWKEVAELVNSNGDYTKPPKTDIQCKNRIDTVKKKYKLEKAKIAAGQGPSRWTFFEKLDQLIGPAAKTNNVTSFVERGARSAPQLRQHQPRSQQRQKHNFRRRRLSHVDSETSESEPSPVSSDSSPPATYEKKRPRRNSSAAAVMPTTKARGGGSADRGGSQREGNWANSVRELSQAILMFGEAYEQAESAKLQQTVEMEKQRMKFVKELEMQRMQFFIKTQLELSQLKNGWSVSTSNHQCNNNSSNSTAANNDNISFSSK